MSLYFYTEHKGIKDCYVDKNGNIYSLMRFKDLGTIEEVAKTNINCKNCIDCKECIECENCINCKNCYMCENCENCINCNYCESCRDCENFYDY